MGVAILQPHFRQSANPFFQNYFSNVPPSETETSLVEIRITRMSFLMGADSLHRQTKSFRNTFESFSQSPKKPWSAFRARASKQMHMYTLRERERELKTKIEKKKKIRVANEREVARADSAQVPRPFARQSRSSTFKINLKINRSIDKIDKIDKIENSVLPQCFSRSPPPSAVVAVVSSRSGQPSRGL